MTRNGTASRTPLIIHSSDQWRPLQDSDKAPGGGFLASRTPTARGDPGPAEALTQARGSDGVHVDLVIADFLVALSVGCWLREGRTLIAMAPGDLVHALHHAGLQALPTGR